MVSSPRQAAIGCRIESDGHYGTIRYIGEVPPTKGEWLGIEWDDPKRGKHDGSHNGKRYFTTSHPTSGSFLRQQKAQLGVSFIPALHDRYGRLEDGGIETSEMYVQGPGSQQTVVEVVGADKVNKQQSHFEELTDISLRNQLIYGTESHEDITATCPRTRFLDLSKNLITSWQEVARITQQLPRLHSLNVSDNRLSLPETPAELMAAFPKLETVFANRMNYSWTEVLQCSSMWPQLEQLHVCFNSITSISNPVGCLQNLSLLNLESNPIKDWQHVLTLAQLPSLSMLILNDTGINKVEFPDCPPGGQTKMFASLKILLANNNNVSDWASVTELNKLPNLEELHFRNNPIAACGPEMSDETIRSIFIARIKRLQMFNRTEATVEERRGAEVDYIKMFGTEWKASGGHQDPAQNKPSADFCNKHPRYQEIIDEYGPAEDSEFEKKTSALKNSLINVTIRCPNRPEKKVVKKKIPVGMTVQKLKALVQRLFKADPSTLNMTYSTEQVEGQVYEFDNDLREIGFYAIDEGDTVNVTW